MSNLPNFPILRPSLLLDFANSKQVDPRITFTRASTATYYDAQGVLRTAASGVPRIDHDPVTGECKGLLIEEARTNLLLNSTIDGANLVTQTVTVTAAAYTISFYGTGTVTLSGAHVASAVGVGAYPSRTILVFTPTAGSLTLTVTGTVQFAQLEAGAFPTSYIPTSTAATTRAADAASMTGTNFSEWYRQDEGTFVVFADVSATTTDSSARVIFAAGDSASFNETMYLFRNSSSAAVIPSIVDGGVGQLFDTSLMSVSVGVAFGAALTYKLNDFGGSANGGSLVTDSSVTVPTVNSLALGRASWAAGNLLNGHIRSIAYYPKRVANSELQALSTI